MNVILLGNENQCGACAPLWGLASAFVRAPRGLVPQPNCRTLHTRDSFLLLASEGRRRG
jgi:hypothetical protein